MLLSVLSNLEMMFWDFRVELQQAFKGRHLQPIRGSVMQASTLASPFPSLAFTREKNPNERRK